MKTDSFVMICFLTKGHFVKIIFGLLCFVFSISTTVSASAPRATSTTPGYYRFMVGDIEVTALLDGTMQLPPAQFLANIKESELKKLLAESHEGPTVVTSVNGFLINTGTKLVLIDTGMGSARGPSLGHMIESLKASGYKPEQVDEIYLTHMHGDHLGGLSSDGKTNYSKAIVRADRRDFEFWLNDKEAEKANEHMKGNFAAAKAALGPYQSSGRAKPFDGETELVAGVFAHPAYGHTPGHTIYTVESQGKKLWLLGDMIHVAAVQFPKPSATMAFDSDSKAALAERLRVFGLVAKADDMMGAAHLAFPGIGHIRKAGTGYVFTPLAYGWVGAK